MTHADMPSGAGEFRVTGWRLNKDYSIDIAGRTTVDEMYDMTVGPKPADVAADPVPVETPVVESPFDRVYTGLESDGSLPNGSVTIPKLKVVPYNHNPDPLFNDSSLWNLTSVWSIVPRATGNVPDLMDVPKAMVLYSTAYSGTADQVFAGPRIVLGGAGQKIRLSATLYNNANWAVRVGLYYYNAAGTYLGGTALDLAAGGGVSSKSAIGTTPANTAFVQVFGYALTNASAFSGQVAASNIRVDLAGTTDLLVDDSVTGPKVLDGTLTDDHITVTTLSSLVANLGTVTAGTITGTTFRTAADGSGNYIELSGTTIKGKDSGGNEIWNVYPAQGPLALTDFGDANFEKAMTSSYFDNTSDYTTWTDTSGQPNTIEGREAARALAMAWYAANGVSIVSVGRWDITSLLPTAPRYVLIAIRATVGATYKAEPIIGPVTTTLGTWVSTPGAWQFTFLPAASTVRTGILGAVTDTRMIIVPTQKIGSGLYIHRSYTGSLTGVSGAKIRIVGVFA